MIFILLCLTSGVQGINYADIVTELKYSNSDYYTIVDNFIIGFNASVRYSREAACQTSFTNLMDKFYEMNVNRTAVPATPGDDPYEG